MGRVNRTSLPDGYFHVYSRATYEPELYRDHRDRQEFLRLLASCEDLHGWTCHAFCLMSTHYHLVVEASREDLSKGVERLNGRYARAFNRRYGRFGHLFAERFATRVIAGEQYLFEVCSYVVLNPVKAGLCVRAEEWPWSYSRYGLTAA
jgi:putative transposase